MDQTAASAILRKTASSAKPLQCLMGLGDVLIVQRRLSTSWKRILVTPVLNIVKNVVMGKVALTVRIVLDWTAKASVPAGKEVIYIKINVSNAEKAFNTTMKIRNV